MKSILTILLFFMVFGSEVRAGGGLVGNGGDIVKCSANSENEFSGFYSLDYLLTYKKSNKNSDIVQVKSLSESFQRIRHILEKNLPELTDYFDSFVLHYKNTMDLTAPRIWEEASYGLVDLKDEKMINLVPANCRVGDSLKINQVVVRQFSAFPGSATDAVVYKFDPDLLSEIENQSPLQASFTAIHEWLWDLNKSPEENRRLNRLFHSQMIETMQPLEAHDALSRLGIEKFPLKMPPVFREDFCQADPTSTKALVQRLKEASTLLAEANVAHRRRQCNENTNCETAWNEEGAFGKKFRVFGNNKIGPKLEIFHDTGTYITCDIEISSSRIVCAEKGANKSVFRGIVTDKCLKISVLERSYFDDPKNPPPEIHDFHRVIYSELNFLP